MSPSENNLIQPPTNTPNLSPEDCPPKSVENTPNQTLNSENNPSKPPEEPQPTLKKRSKLSKTTKTALFIVTWIILLLLSAVLAFFIKPNPEIVYTNAIIEAFKFSKADSETVVETVDDLDYYGYYNTNPLTFNNVTDWKSKDIYTISGLKNKSVEDTINQRIESVTTELYTLEPSRVNMYITANYFNLLSVRLRQYSSSQPDPEEYLNFDLNTGQELNFDDLFPKNVNLTALLYKSFYDELSTNIQFEKLQAKNRLSSESSYPDPTSCSGAQYCPYPGETYDSLRALIAEYDNQLANIEQVTLDSLQNYLSGERKFYLNSYGPAFVLSDGTVIEMQLKDNIRYAIYLKKYRSPDSLFENDSLAKQNLFFTQQPHPNLTYTNEETDSYLFNYIDTTDTFSVDNIDPSLKQSFSNYLKTKGLNITIESGKFHHILAEGYLVLENNILIGETNIFRLYETDKPYYESTYRKAIIDGKTGSAWMSPTQPAQTGHYDESRVTELQPDQSRDYENSSVIVTRSGAIIDNLDDILINPTDSPIGWKDYLKQQAYSYVCTMSYNPKCYTDEEKQSHDFIYNFSLSDIELRLKDNSETGSSYFWRIHLSDIPEQYLNPKIFFN